ncbi:hypothetical protein [Superficieibacter sp. 1612_C1]|uniref:hypothetical protein n=1 Tax=Superficieibacter sp. 1612_C1 TaxID=2780382 RepID=UPI0018846E69|nr:hypothetical protein [Superficieibacter sp. 1612_C1]
MKQSLLPFIHGLTTLLLCLGAFSVHADITLTASDEQQINALVDRWNDVLNRAENARPQSLYAENVEWFGKTLPAQQVIANSQAFLAKNKEYQQRIVSTLNIQPVSESDDRVMVRFVKSAGLETFKEKNYPAELQMRKTPAGWRIVSETDAITRANQNKDVYAGVIKGKFDGKNSSYAWMSDADPRTGGMCTEESDCDCTLWNSDPHVKPVKISQCLVGHMEMLSGLDDSGRDRVVAFPEWWTSAMRVVYVYDIQQKQWIKTMSGFSMNINLQEAASAADLVKRDPQHPGKVKVTQATFDEAAEEATTEVVSQTLLTLK